MSYLNPSKDELDDHLLDHYGYCDRDHPTLNQGLWNDCYHGKDVRGKDNGCLKIGWKGRACPHWHPGGIDEIRKAYNKKDVAG